MSYQGVFLIQFPGRDLKEIHLGDLVSVVGTVSGTQIPQFAGISYHIILINAQNLNYWPGPATLKPKIYYPWELTPRTVKDFCLGRSSAVLRPCGSYQTVWQSIR